MSGTPQWRQDKRLWDKKIEKVSRFLKESVPTLKAFTPKNSNLEVLDSYDKVLDDSYWSKWEVVNNPEEIGSLGLLGLLEVAMQFDMAPGRGRVLEQGNMVSNWLYVEYECVCIVKYLEVLMGAY